jgi:hypothetical protein
MSWSHPQPLALHVYERVVDAKDENKAIPNPPHFPLIYKHVDSYLRSHKPPFLT